MAKCWAQLLWYKPKSGTNQITLFVTECVRSDTNPQCVKAQFTKTVITCNATCGQIFKAAFPPELVTIYKCPPWV